MPIGASRIVDRHTIDLKPFLGARLASPVDPFREHVVGMAREFRHVFKDTGRPEGTMNMGQDIESMGNLNRYWHLPNIGIDIRRTHMLPSYAQINALGSESTAFRIYAKDKPLNVSNASGIIWTGYNEENNLLHEFAGLHNQFELPEPVIGLYINPLGSLCVQFGQNITLSNGSILEASSIFGIFFGVWQIEIND